MRSEPRGQAVGVRVSSAQSAHRGRVAVRRRARFLLGPQLADWRARFTLWSVERRFFSQTGDSRIPFALACGARGCALLDGTPYQADTLDAQLNDAVKRFVQNENNVKLRPDGIHLSRLFKLYAEDIRAALPEGRTHLLQFVWAFLPEACLTRPGCDTRGDLDKACGPRLEGCAMKFEPFDWQLASRP